ncbi:MAG: NUDIX hydrolase [Sphaerochaetaceae bacterium]|nr:NUDIX hydrolase [Sphaerochaetaceae bacterium]
MRFPYRGAGIALVYENKVLLGLRSKKPFRNTWCVPGGGFEKSKDRDSLSNAVREFSEETGVALDLSKLQYVGKFNLRVPFFRWTTFFYKTDKIITELKPDEFYTLKWVSLDNIKKETAGNALRPFAVSELKLLKSLL